MSQENHQETAMIIEKEIKRLNSYENIDPFINLCGFYHSNRCEMDTNCLYCRFICTLTIYLILWMALTKFKFSLELIWIIFFYVRIS